MFKSHFCDENFLLEKVGTKIYKYSVGSGLDDFKSRIQIKIMRIHNIATQSRFGSGSSTFKSHSTDSLLPKKAQMFNSMISKCTCSRRGINLVRAHFQTQWSISLWLAPEFLYPKRMLWQWEEGGGVGDILQIFILGQTRTFYIYIYIYNKRWDRLRKRKREYIRLFSLRWRKQNKFFFRYLLSRSGRNKEKFWGDIFIEYKELVFIKPTVPLQLAGENSEVTCVQNIETL
jgi:hypothetical protein